VTETLRMKQLDKKIKKHFDKVFKTITDNIDVFIEAKKLTDKKRIESLNNIISFAENQMFYFTARLFAEMGKSLSRIDDKLQYGFMGCFKSKNLLNELLAHVSIRIQQITCNIDKKSEEDKTNETIH
jgi:hypothetical protein